MVLPAHRIEPAAEEPSRTAFVLHGILGSKQNWRGFARKMARRWPRWRLVLADLRNHGDTEPATPPHTLAACAADLAELAAEVGRPQAIVGHSFGGKVALAYARDHGEGLEQAWVLDSLPGPDAGEDSDVIDVIAALREIDMPLERRADVVDLLAERGFSTQLGRWMTTNLDRAADGYRWRFDLDAVEEMLSDYARADFWPLLDRTDPAVHVVRAGRSDRWTDDIVERLRASRAHEHVLADAGHWVHVDDPEGLLDLLAEGFAD